ncbi:MAG: biotin transporter BioY, partial [Planctomycetota bacterium]
MLMLSTGTSPSTVSALGTKALFGSRTRTVFRVLAWAAVVAAGARVAIPLPGTDVPMTLQLPAVLLAGVMLSPTEALYAMVLYLTVGTLGLPVFAPASAGILGPTGGYLLGYA